VADMKTDAVAANTTDLDEELVEVLIAISVISKRLAKKITAKTKTTEDKEDEQVLRTDRTDCQHEIQEG